MARVRRKDVDAPKDSIVGRARRRYGVAKSALTTRQEELATKQVVVHTRFVRAGVRSSEMVQAGGTVVLGDFNHTLCSTHYVNSHTNN